jgi:alpha-D-xyloside xylohydrolase
MNVYLPKSAGWYDFWTGKRFAGGQTIKTATPQDKIPVFVKAGSIIPMGKIMQYTGEKPSDTLEIRVYKGADGSFSLYEDEGDNYNYESGKYTIIPFKWDEKFQTLSIGSLQGGYAGALAKRVFNIVFVSEANGNGIAETALQKVVVYNGININITSK